MKQKRVELLSTIEEEANSKAHFTFFKMDIEDRTALNELFEKESFDMVCNFAGQAGVRYSLENPQIYISTNIQGFFNLIDLATKYQIKRFIYASSSSVYGANEHIPYKETDQTESPVSLYAATKKTNELLAHCYSTIYGMTCIGLRFFTVYGPWGRPDMSPFIFTKAIMEGLPLKVFNDGNMLRDFTYIDDIVESIFRMLTQEAHSIYEIYNIGNASPIEINQFLHLLEEKIGRKAHRINMPIQPGDMLVTCSDSNKLLRDYNYRPQTTLNEGLTNFLAWYQNYYR